MGLSDRNHHTHARDNENRPSGRHHLPRPRRACKLANSSGPGTSTTFTARVDARRRDRGSKLSLDSLGFFLDIARTPRLRARGQQVQLDPPKAKPGRTRPAAPAAKRSDPIDYMIRALARWFHYTLPEIGAMTALGLLDAGQVPDKPSARRPAARRGYLGYQEPGKPTKRAAAAEPQPWLRCRSTSALLNVARDARPSQNARHAPTIQEVRPEWQNRLIVTISGDTSAARRRNVEGEHVGHR